MSQYYTTHRIGPKRSYTPEGFLLCEEVPIARCGEQIYSPDEIPVSAGPDGRVRIVRDAEEVFRADSIASVNGKSVVDEHPDEDVSPENWRHISLGTVFNPRRGTGDQEDMLVVDMMIYDKRGIDLVLSGKTQLSVGYDAEYEEIAPGHGRQKSIIVNHIALVRNGRCGPRCSIGDHVTHDCKCKEMDMPKKTTRRNRLMAMLGFKDEEAFEKALNEELPTEDEDEAGEHTHVHVHMNSAKEEAPDVTQDADELVPDWFTQHVAENNARFARIEEMLEKALASKSDTGDEELEEEELEEIPEETRDRAAKSKDSAYFAETFQEVAATAEIIVPGIHIPTFDRAASPKATVDNINRLRRTTLDLAYHQPSTRGVIDELLKGKKFDSASMTTHDLRGLFNSVGVFRRRENVTTQAKAAPDIRAGGGLGVKSKIKTPAEFNKAMAEFYSRQQA